MKKLRIAIAGLAALGGLFFVNARVLSQNDKDVKPASAQSAPSTKIGVVNILKVVKDFKKAEALGTRILADVSRYEIDLNKKKEDLKKRQAEIQIMPEGPQKDQFSKDLRHQIEQLQDEDQAAQKDIKTRREDMAVEIHKNIQTVIDSLARHYGFEMVLTCPDVTTPEEHNKIADAMRHITAQGAYVAWRDPRLDITEDCIKWLNYYYKAPEGSTTAAPANGGNSTAPSNTQPPR